MEIDALHELRTTVMDQLRTLTDEDGREFQDCPHTKGDTYLATLGVQEWLTINLCMWLLFAMTVAFTVLAYVGLLLVTRRSMARASGRRGVAWVAGQREHEAKRAAAATVSSTAV